MALGGGYRHPFGDQGAFDLDAAWSLKNFKKIDASFALPRFAARRLAIEIDGRFIDAPAVAFYGRGPGSREEDRSTFGYRPTTVGATAGFTPREAVTFGGGVDYMTIDTVSAFDGPVESQPLLATSPGLGAGRRYLRSRAFATVDWRQRPGYSGKGGLYRVELEDYSERSGLPSGFRSLEAEVVQLVPIARAKWVIALRGLATLTDVDWREQQCARVSVLQVPRQPPAPAQRRVPLDGGPVPRHGAVL
jgi:hypothetical protein